MNQHLQTILNFIQQSEHLSDEEKSALLKAAKDAAKELEITSFKLDRTEKVKRTTAILLEETIEELEQKRKAVEAQNRELEIESSLERVRTIAMSMNKADDMLAVCKTISHQLELLDVKEIRNVQTAIFYKEKGTYMNYEYYTKHNKTFITETTYNNNEKHAEFAENMQKGNGQFFEMNINGDEVKDWIAYQKTTNVFIDDYLYNATSLSYYWHSLGPVALGISTYQPLEEENKILFNRFLKVFELAYRRYLDIEKAEANAKEAQIEAALEKVRSRSLAVHKSEEFKDVVKIIFEKLQELGIEADAASLNIIIEGSKDIEVYISGQNKNGLDIRNFRLLYFNEVISNDRYSAQQSGIDFFSKTYNRKEKNNFFEYQFEFSEMKNVPDDVRQKIFNSEEYTVSMALARHSIIVVNHFEGKSLSKYEVDVLKRFSNVFEQAYIRFLDLQKAEAQTRETQIELALERVRARTMAMQKSEELGDISFELVKQVQSLGVATWHCAFNIYDEDQNSSTEWGSNAMGTYPLYKTPREGIFLKYYQIGQAGQTLHVEVIGEDTCADHYAYLCTLPGVGEELVKLRDSGVSFPTSQIDHLAYFKYGYLLFITYEAVPEAHDIFKRFAKVFEQTYTRFLDLQKAEAQTRESQIQLALERVRARTMAMQKSDELSETAHILFKQFKQLGEIPLQIIIGIFNEEKKVIEFRITGLDGSGSKIDQAYNMDIDEPVLLHKVYTAWKEQRKSVIIELTGKDLRNWSDYKTKMGGITESASDISEDERRFVGVGFFTRGMISFSKQERISEETIKILERFATVFDQTYTRFLDIQKAEAQARESQIQLALERIRARTMAMQHSDELSETASEMFRQIQSLGLKTWSCGFNIIDKENSLIKQWVSTGDGRILPSFETPSDEDIFQRFTRAAEKDKSFYVEEMGGEALKAHYKYMASLPEVKKLLDEFQSLEITPPDFQVFHLASFSYGYLMFITHQPAPEFYDVFKRFAAVFDQTYRRFLDLQKAEAQAREAQIEAALERVRSRSMGMQKSDELKEVIQIVYEQFVHLNIHVEHTGFIMDYKERDDMLIWLADQHAVPFQITIPYFDSPHWNSFNEAKATGKDFFTNHLNFEEKNKFYHELFKLFPVPDEAKEYYFTCPGLAISTVLLDNVGLYIENFSGTPYSDEDNKTLMRFGKVFQQTYTRFNDLQKAEAQARESRIEAVLERVRSRTMAMQKSDELTDVAGLLFEQVSALGIKTWTAGFNVWSEDNNSYVDYITSPNGGFIEPYTVLTETAEALKDISNARKSGVEFDVQYVEGEKIKQLYLALTKLDEKQYEIMLQDGVRFPSHQYEHFVFGSKVSLMFITYEPVPEAHDIFKRLGKVFEQTYTRFLDLQKAEAQSRESQIELSLERVRAKTMAMHNSTDVGATAAVMVEELKKLGIETIRCGIGIMHEPGDMEVWTISTDENNKTDIIIGWLDMHIHPLLHGAFESWRKKNESYSYELKDDDLLNYYNAINNYPGYPIRYDTASLPMLIHHNEFAFTEGILFAFSLQQLTDEQRKIFKRFAGVFGQTYRRYLDLKKAEAQAKEAQIEAALERVRSRTLAMQKSDELAETSAVLFKQLISLGIKPNRLYISIMKDDEGETEFWITDEDGNKVSMAYEDNLNNNPSFKKMFKGWKQQKKSLVIDMKGKELKNYFNYLSSIHVPFKGGLVQKRRLQYIAYFSKGFIGMASPDEQPAETLQLLERFAYVFNLTFTRFNDLQIAEAHALQAEHDLIEIKAARKKAEETLVELQSTQKQLVQSEKMASLGELTAGIAHEIQNPLNFVNNFSEVNKEMIEEMKEELAKGNQQLAIGNVQLATGNMQLAIEIANDIEANEEKINHHGKRADAIVKGMLQHSRKSSGTKEPTDINALCDEYLRLSYHGLRAKDKSFNADFKTDFDESIGKINIVPQDIGRVLLNIINNAFYAVNEKRITHNSQLTTDYEPLVSIQTKKINDKVEIKVSDNGNGIPQNIIDKIFQPFFTTKPTGQGTGLGLSLAYDIITKEHSGSIKVESKEGEGSTFTISLSFI